jgi:L-alanine-DL-glutamate epimerase-like enolase superfamily enzyme
MNSADFIVAGAATFGVRASDGLRGGFTGALRTAHLADAFRLRAEVHGPGVTSRHLCMAIANTTYYESLILSVDVETRPEVDADGYVHAPTSPGVALPVGPDYPPELRHYVDSDVPVR